MAKAKFTQPDRLPVISLRPSPGHPRKHLAENSKEALKELKWLRVSIHKRGFCDPIVVEKVDDKTYHIIDGVKRARATEQLGIDFINCIVYHGLNRVESAHLSYQLNTDHPSRPLTAVEVGKHIERMRDEFGCSYSDLEKMGYEIRSEMLDGTRFLTSSIEAVVHVSDFAIAEEATLPQDDRFLKTVRHPVHCRLWPALNLKKAGTTHPLFPIYERHFDSAFLDQVNN